jgi:PAS domain-containing protein
MAPFRLGWASQPAFHNFVLNLRRSGRQLGTAPRKDLLRRRPDFVPGRRCNREVRESPMSKDSAISVGAAPPAAVEKLLRQDEKRMAEFLDMSSGAYLQVDAQGLLTLWDSRAERIFGRSRKDALGQEWSRLLLAPEASALWKTRSPG